MHVNDSISSSRQKIEYDGNYTISGVYLDKADLVSTLLVCFDSHLANTAETERYSVSLKGDITELRLNDRIARVDILSGCNITNDFRELEISDQDPRRYINHPSEYWYVDNAGTCALYYNTLGCYVVANEENYVELKIVPADYTGSNFDLRYALYVPSVFVDIVFSPLYAVFFIMYVASDGGGLVGY